MENKPKKIIKRIDLQQLFNPNVPNLVNAIEQMFSGYSVDEAFIEDKTILVVSLYLETTLAAK